MYFYGCPMNRVLGVSIVQIAELELVTKRLHRDEVVRLTKGEVMAVTLPVRSTRMPKLPRLVRCCCGLTCGRLNWLLQKKQARLGTTVIGGSFTRKPSPS